MPRPVHGLIAALLAAVPAAPAAPAAQPEGYTPRAHNVPFPAGFESRFIRYGVVEDPDRKIIRFLYVNPEALASARPGEPLPYGTVVVMADRRARLDASGEPLRDRDGRLVPAPDIIAISVQQKERGRGEGYPPATRNGEWEYATFTAAGERRAVRLDGCFSCHAQARAAQDHLFDLRDHIPRGGR